MTLQAQNVLAFVCVCERGDTLTVCSSLIVGAYV